MKPALAAFTLSICISCAPKPADLHPAIDSITSADLLAQIKTLSSDEYEGRSPGTHGEDLTVAYLTDQFKKMGLKPGNPDGTYIQKVPLVGYTSDTKVEITAKGKKLAMKPRTEYVAGSRRYTAEIKVPTSDIVFVGYGVVAPEYNWDDYKGVDVKGKTILMLVNDPPVPDPNDPSKLDEKMFKGKAMTYYGRWTYKYEIASEKGAAAALIVHETGPAGYPFEVVGSRHGREDFDIQKPDKNMSRVPVEGWITYDKAAELCKMAGQDLAALKKAAVSKDFRPVTLDAKASFDIKNTLREVDSRNVIARIEGSDPQLKNQYVIFSAHWDHLGKDPSLKGDQIFNGALDNASGTAGLLELAQAFTKISPAPKRSILILSVTAEERGLLGSKYYAENPL
jgi:Zn-dependent M28 family amino/carboxypeptidase